MSRFRAAPVALVLLAAAATSLAACSGDGSVPATAAKIHPRVRGGLISARSLFPDFASGRHHYVARCKRGGLNINVSAPSEVRVGFRRAAPRSGGFRVKVHVSPGQDFRIHVDGGAAEGTYRVRCLPRGFPEWHFQIVRPSGHGLFTVAVTSPSASKPRSWVIIFDRHGVPRWWFLARTRTLGAAVLPDGTIYLAACVW